MRPPEIFETARLSLRPPRVSDAPAAFAAYASDPEVTRYLSWKYYTDVLPLAEFFALCALQWEKSSEGHYAWLMFLRETGQLVGSIGVLPEKGKVSFGYVLGRAYWNHGYTVEALRPLIDWALAQPGVYRAWAFCDVDNPASARVMEKAGMTREGILRRWISSPSIGPEPRDCIVCAKVR